MSNYINTELHNEVQGHIAFMSAWKTCKAHLSAGRKLRLTIKEQKRSTDQNSKLWAMLSEISNQVDWYGEKLSSEDWKHVLTASLKKQRAVRGIDGGFVVLGLYTSKMTKAEMADLITLMEAFGAERGVVFADVWSERDLMLAA